MPSYGQYLRIDQLLDLQKPLSSPPEHDETLFIIIHQVYELWFKEVLHELDYLKARLREGDTQHATTTLQRVLRIFKTLVGQIDVLETMTPLEFLAFRDRLESGSGFQSAQFREVEFVLGVKRRGMLENFGSGTPERERLDRRWKEDTVWDAFLGFLARQGLAGPELARPDVTRPIEPSPEVQRVLIRIYRDDGAVAELCERLVDLDEALQEWRYRHVKMVQRTIGTKRGTGGSSGSEYLVTTLNQPVFPDLWAIRTEL
jgi:tryptophan 2,3-dioxygenase